MQPNAATALSADGVLSAFLRSHTSPDDFRRVRAAPPPGDNAIEFVMSDGSVDRMGDVIEPKGWVLDHFTPDRNPVALFNHDKNQIIGTWRDVRVVKNRLLGRLELAARGTSELVDTVRSLVEQKNSPRRLGRLQGSRDRAAQR